MPSRRETMWRGSAVRWWPRNRNYVADLEAISAEAVANNFIRGSGEFSPLEAPGPFVYRPCANFAESVVSARIKVAWSFRAPGGADSCRPKGCVKIDTRHTGN